MMPVAKTGLENPLTFWLSGVHRALYVQHCGVLPGHTMLKVPRTVETQLRGLASLPGTRLLQGSGHGHFSCRVYFSV